jgi:hypothetical protein
MVWSEYVEQTTGENDYSDDEDDSIPPRRLGIEDWTAWYSEDLLNMWFSLVQYREDSGRKHDILKFGTYTDFCEFCYRFSHGYAA